jgi:hypothetical protein
VKQHISAVVAIASHPDLSKQVTTEMKNGLIYEPELSQLTAKEKRSREKQGKRLS